MKIGVLTSSYKTTAVESRERLAIADAQIEPLVALLKKDCDLNEVMIISTCNRVEVYFHAKNTLKKLIFSH